MKSALLDSDILLDFFYDRKPHSFFASYILTLCERKELIGYVTPVILSHVYYLLRKSSTHARVIQKLNQFLTFTEILPMDKSTILKAMNSQFKDFEDALQNYASEDSGLVDLVFTRNLRDYQYSTLPVMSPEDYYTVNIK